MTTDCTVVCQDKELTVRIAVACAEAAATQGGATGADVWNAGHAAYLSQCGATDAIKNAYCRGFLCSAACIPGSVLMEVSVRLGHLLEEFRSPLLKAMQYRDVLLMFASFAAAMSDLGRQRHLTLTCQQFESIVHNIIGNSRNASIFEDTGFGISVNAINSETNTAVPLLQLLTDYFLCHEAEQPEILMSPIVGLLLFEVPDPLDVFESSPYCVPVEVVNRVKVYVRKHS